MWRACELSCTLLLSLLLLQLSVLPTSALPSTLKHNDAAPLARDTPLPQPPGEGSRHKRQTPGDPSEPAQETCDFGTNNDVVLCSWMNVNVTSLKWRPSRGENAYWMGGPVEDVTYGDKFGGYAVFETSERPDLGLVGISAFESAMLISPLRPSTGAEGVCVKYWYSIGGLSADRVRVLLHPMPNAKFIKEDDRTTSSLEGANDKPATAEECKNPEMDKNKNRDQMLQMLSTYDGSDDVVLWEARDVTMGKWSEGQIVYTYNMPHAIIVEGIPVSSGDINRRFRGFIAIDELNFADSSECGAFCTFEAGTCGWVQDENLDDFDWTLSRGSLNPSTGPPRDRSSFSNGGMMGGFAVIDSGYPRRPGDRARLLTEEFQATDPDTPLCMRFWTHMYGNGVGSLRVLIINSQDSDEETIWEISGEAGNLWYQGQVPISSSKPFNIAFEGEVGRNNLGDIALDDISIIQGPCPSAPQIAGNNLGDCTFEVDECGWISPGARDRLDEIDWVRTVASENREPRTDHTIGTQQGYYMTVPKGSVQRAGDRAWLRSTTMKGSTDTMCVSFWYYMYEPFIEPSGPSLGALTLYVWSQDPLEGTTILRPLWSLRNHQGPNWLYAQSKVKSENDYAVIFEGTWGQSRGNGFMGLDDITIFMGDCTTMPDKAYVSLGDCDFQRDSCSWVNTTTDPDFRWASASISRRPTSLPDHTFGGSVGYVFFDVFNQNANKQTLRKTSPVLDGKESCIGFWYASFGSGSESSLSLERLLPEGDDTRGEQIWITSSKGRVQTRPEWTYAQAPIPANNKFKLAFVGEASNGGYAIDDIKIYSGLCKVRPKEADPNYVAEREPPLN
uniref:MAM and LDL-receptor class A domain-containing protein 2-like n=1 Tax=Hirondellea gigas TaxID=1518452 RepID=A0A6A7FLR1_9CRUS